MSINNNNNAFTHIPTSQPTALWAHEAYDTFLPKNHIDVDGKQHRKQRRHRLCHSQHNFFAPSGDGDATTFPSRTFHVDLHRDFQSLIRSADAMWRRRRERPNHSHAQESSATGTTNTSNEGRPYDAQTGTNPSFTHAPPAAVDPDAPGNSRMHFNKVAREVMTCFALVRSQESMMADQRRQHQPLAVNTTVSKSANDANNFAERKYALRRHTEQLLQRVEAAAREEQDNYAPLLREYLAARAAERATPQAATVHDHTDNTADAFIANTLLPFLAHGDITATDPAQSLKKTVHSSRQARPLLAAVMAGNWHYDNIYWNLCRFHSNLNAAGEKNGTNSCTSAVNASSSQNFVLREEFCHELSRYYALREEAAARARLRALRNNDAEEFYKHINLLKISSLLQVMEKTNVFIQRISAKLKEQKGSSAGDDKNTEKSAAGHNNTAGAVSANYKSEYDRFMAYVAQTREADSAAAAGGGGGISLAHSTQVFIERQPRGLRGTLFPHQMDGLRFLYSLHRNRLNGILADEMGVGKTIQTLSFLLHLKEERVAAQVDGDSNSKHEESKGHMVHMVLAPLSIIKEWREAAETFTPEAPQGGETGGDEGASTSCGLRTALLLSLLKDAQSCHGDAHPSNGGVSPVVCGAVADEIRGGGYDLVLCPIHSVRSPPVQEVIRRVRWEYLIIDEAHKAVSNFNTLTASFLLSLTDPSADGNGEEGEGQSRSIVRRRLLLTGTPLNSNLRELYNLLYFLNPQIFHGEDDSFESVFQKPFEFINSVEGASSGGAQGGADAPPALSEDERQLLVLRLHQILRPFMLRRTKKDIDKNLRISFHELRCPLTGLQRELLDLLTTEKRTPQYNLRDRRDDDRDETSSTSSCSGSDDDNKGSDSDAHAQRGQPVARSGAVNSDGSVDEKRLYQLLKHCPYSLTSRNVSESSAQLLCNHAFLLPFAPRIAENYRREKRRQSSTGVPMSPPAPTTYEHLMINSGKFLVLDMLLTRCYLARKKVVIFTHWLDQIDVLEEYFNHKRLNNYSSRQASAENEEDDGETGMRDDDDGSWRDAYVTLTGSTSEEERKNNIRTFLREEEEEDDDANEQTDDLDGNGCGGEVLPRRRPRVNFFIISMKAGGCGINLQRAAHIVVQLERDYTLTNEEQSIARVFRIGQRHTVRAFTLSTAHPSEGRVRDRAGHKDRYRQSIIEEGDYQIGDGAGETAEGEKDREENEEELEATVQENASADSRQEQSPLTTPDEDDTFDPRQTRGNVIMHPFLNGDVLFRSIAAAAAASGPNDFDESSRTKPGATPDNAQELMESNDLGAINRFFFGETTSPSSETHSRHAASSSILSRVTDRQLSLFRDMIVYFDELIVTEEDKAAEAAAQELTASSARTFFPMQVLAHTRPPTSASELRAMYEQEERQLSEGPPPSAETDSLCALRYPAHEWVLLLSLWAAAAVSPSASLDTPLSGNLPPQQQQHYFPALPRALRSARYIQRFREQSAWYADMARRERQESFDHQWARGMALSEMATASGGGGAPGLVKIPAFFIRKCAEEADAAGDDDFDEEDYYHLLKRYRKYCKAREEEAAALQRRKEERAAAAAQKREMAAKQKEERRQQQQQMRDQHRHQEGKVSQRKKNTAECAGTTEVNAGQRVTIEPKRCQNPAAPEGNSDVTETEKETIKPAPSQESPRKRQRDAASPSPPPAPLVKRGPGRPRKCPRLEEQQDSSKATTTTTAAESQAATVINKEEVQKITADTSSNSPDTPSHGALAGATESVSAATAVEPVKRRPGRPRRAPPAPAATAAEPSKESDASTVTTLRPAATQESKTQSTSSAASTPNAAGAPPVSCTQSPTSEPQAPRRRRRPGRPPKRRRRSAQVAVSKYASKSPPSNSNTNRQDEAGAPIVEAAATTIVTDDTHGVSDCPEASTPPHRLPSSSSAAAQAPHATPPAAQLSTAGVAAADSPAAAGAATTTAAVEEEMTAVKRRPGRPRKNPLPAPQQLAGTIR